MTLPSPDPSQWFASRILIRTEVGSTAHGTGLEGKEDYDEMVPDHPYWFVINRWLSNVYDWAREQI